MNLTITDQSGDFCKAVLYVSVANKNDLPVIENPGRIVLKVGDELLLKINASDADKDAYLLFYDNTDVFDIDPNTGEIQFRAGEDMTGNHIITIGVSDGGSRVNITFELVIASANRSDNKIPEIVVLVLFAVLLLVGFIVNRGKKKE